jgi:hypothetical protein
MPIDTVTLQVPKKTFKRGGKTFTIPAHKVVRVLPPHTIFDLARAQKKQRRNERAHGLYLAQEIRAGKMQVVDGQVVEVDPYGIKPPSKVGVTSRVMDYLRLKFGFY